MITGECTLARGVDLGDVRGAEADAAGLIVVNVHFFLGDLPGRLVDGDLLRFLVLERPVDVDGARLRGPGFRRLRGRRRGRGSASFFASASFSSSKSFSIFDRLPLLRASALPPSWSFAPFAPRFLPASAWGDRQCRDR